jgi:replicative DNA helicase
MTRKVTFDQYNGDHMERMLRHAEKAPQAVPSPWGTLNEVCGEEGGRIGPAKGWLVVLGGADGAGKSYASQNMVAAAVKAGKRVGVINFEMSEIGYTTRMLSIVTGAPKWQLEQGEFFSRKVWVEASKNFLKLVGGRLMVNREAAFNIDDMRSLYQFFVSEGAEMMVVDYAQLISVPGARDLRERTEEVSNVLRELAHSTDIYTLALSQLTRETKKGKVTRHGLYGGGCWENNANLIVLIDHEFMVHDPHSGVIYTRLLVDKNRHGMAPVEIPIRIDLESMRWEEYVPGTDPGDPWNVAAPPPQPAEEPEVGPPIEGDLW